MKFIQAFKWSTINSFVIHLLQLIFSILFARLLQPKDFGLIAIILAITAFLKVFIDNGLGAFLIYKDDPDQIDKSSIFWINLLIGIFVAAILIISSQFVSSFYNEPLLQILSYFFAFELIIASFSIVQIAMFRKERNYKKIFLAQVTGLISSSLVCLFLAIKGYGVWSLVIRSLTMALISVIMIWYFGKWKPDFNLSFGRLKKMFSYSIP